MVETGEEQTSRFLRRSQQCQAKKYTDHVATFFVDEADENTTTIGGNACVLK